ncbi:site-specific integrase [archaeon]|jgi:integrase|nr:site-specific integrase [archaeon]
MAEEDIYKNKKRYERVMSEIDSWLIEPKNYKGMRGRRKYYIKNKVNLNYFYTLAKLLETKDLSYARRRRLQSVLLTTSYVLNINLKDATRDDINEVMAFMHTVYKTVISKQDFIKDLKCLWRMLFPELDRQGRPDETVTPYVIRHLSRKIDKSKEKLRNERYTIEEFQKIITFFNGDPKIQAFITSIHETFTRPQELCYLKIRDFKFFDNYGVAYVSEHGKEGCKPIQFENLSYPYILKWYRMHPLRDDPNAFFFITTSNNHRHRQLTNNAVNKRIREACKALGIDKSITCYSLKRMGITIARMNGVSDKEIISKAGWTSGKQLSTYDLGTREEALRQILVRKGLVKAETLEEKKFVPKQKLCGFCQILNGHMDKLCNGCLRPLNREHIEAMEESHKKLMNNQLMSRIDKLESMFKQKVES